jgi:hypothetical protein
VTRSAPPRREVFRLRPLHEAARIGMYGTIEVPGTGIEPVRGKPPQDFKLGPLAPAVLHIATKCNVGAASRLCCIAVGVTMYPLREGTVREKVPPDVDHLQPSQSVAGCCKAGIAEAARRPGRHRDRLDAGAGAGRRGGEDEAHPQLGRCLPTHATESDRQTDPWPSSRQLGRMRWPAKRHHHRTPTSGRRFQRA